MDMEEGPSPSGITENYPAVIIMDNDDFNSDTLTGASLSNHHTNVMFVQNVDLSNKTFTLTKRPTLTTSGALKNLVEDLNKITPLQNHKDR